MCEEARTYRDRLNALLTEYKALRDEYRMLAENARSYVYTSLVVTGVIIVAAVESGLPGSILLSFLFAAALWRHHAEAMGAVAKIGTYIEQFIEPEVDGLRWETMLRQVGSHAAPVKGGVEPVLQGLFKHAAGVHSVIVLGNIGAFVLTWQSCGGSLVALAILVSLCVLVWVGLCWSHATRGLASKPTWDAAWRQAKAVENPTHDC